MIVQDHENLLLGIIDQRDRNFMNTLCGHGFILVGFTYLKIPG
jgi:hypothetical protein